MNYLLISFFLTVTIGVVAQDKIELKDGKVFQGKILEYVSGDHLVFETLEGTRLTLNLAELEQWDFGKNMGQLKERGYFNNTSIGFLYGLDTKGKPNTSMSIQMVNGYRFNQRFQLGIGIGMESILKNAYFPLFLEGRYYFKKSSFSPFLGWFGGYNFYDFYDGDDKRAQKGYWNREQGQNKRDGGVMSGVQIGVRNYASKNLGFTVSVGYRFQKLTGKKDQYGVVFYNSAVPITEKQYLHRMDVKVGLLFN